MVSLSEVADMAMALPEVTEGSRFQYRTWFVRGTGFVWERPLSKADIRRFGAAKPPEGPLLALRVTDLAEKEAVLATASSALFDIEHFKRYPAVLVQLSSVERDELQQAIVDAWLACAPPKLAEEFLQHQQP